MQTHETHFPMLLASKISQAIPLRSRHIRSVRAHIFSCGECSHKEAQPTQAGHGFCASFPSQIMDLYGTIQRYRNRRTFATAYTTKKGHLVAIVILSVQEGSFRRDYMHFLNLQMEKMYFQIA